MNVAILGATGGIGRVLARAMAARGDRLFLLGRSPAELSRSGSDLRARCGDVVAGTARCDLLDAESIASGLDAAWAALGTTDAVVVTAGLYATQDAYEADPGACEQMLTVNFTRTVRFCEEARTRLLARGGGTLCVFASVAADRARAPIVAYGASKAGLAYYAEGLDHRFRAKGLRTVLVKPGFVRTGMTAGLPEPPFAAEPEAVVGPVLRAIDRGRPEVYAPPIWRLVAAVVRLLPREVMRRVSF